MYEEETITYWDHATSWFAGSSNEIVDYLRFLPPLYCVMHFLEYHHYKLILHSEVFLCFVKKK